MTGIKDKKDCFFFNFVIVCSHKFLMSDLSRWSSVIVVSAFNVSLIAQVTVYVLLIFVAVFASTTRVAVDGAAACFSRFGLPSIAARESNDDAYYEEEERDAHDDAQHYCPGVISRTVM